ncbi:MAG: hypothetical protein AAF752_03490, partial [Bacteroidota bacterium]
MSAQLRAGACGLLLLFATSSSFAQVYHGADSGHEGSDFSIVRSTMETVRDTMFDTLKQLGLHATDLDWSGTCDHPDELKTAVRNLQSHVRELKREARRMDDDVRVDQLNEIARIVDELDDAIDDLEPALVFAPRSKDGRLLPGTYDEESNRIRTEKGHTRFEDGDRDYEWRYSHDWGYESWSDGTITGQSSLFAESIYRSQPAIRYNRVEGLVLGVGRNALERYSWDRARIYGQLGYAFGLNDWRYTAGFEIKTSRRSDAAFATKIGVSAYKNTFSEDRWKIGPVTNSVGSFFAGEDFYDYFEVDGVSVYIGGDLRAVGELTLALRTDDYFSLGQNTDWNLFGADGFRPNPFVDEGRIQSVVARYMAGKAKRLYSRPRGATLQVEGELAGGDLGGDYTFRRVQADGRIYVPFGREATLSLRSRAGAATDEVPFQKAFA